MMKGYFKSIASLTIICAVSTLLLAYTNMLTEPIIEKNDVEAENAALLVVMPDGKDFSPVDISEHSLPETVTGVYRESGGGYVIKLNASGYSSDMIILCGVNSDGKVTGATCLSSNETLGHEKTYGERLVDATVDTIDSVDTVSSATKTTSGYKNAVKDALFAAKTINGEGGALNE